MNFTREIKRDLLTRLPRKDCCRRAAVAALLSTGGAFGENGFWFVSENERVAEYFLSLVETAFSVRPEVKEATLDPKRERDKLTLACEGERAAEVVREASRPLSELAGRECCALAYLRAAFLGGGSCTLPRDGAKTGYHLEFVFSSRETAEEFCELMGGFELIPKLVVRKKGFVVYLKSRDLISDFLSVVGSESALGTLETVSAAREASNAENRVGNCFAGNADKAAIASAAQVVAFERLLRSGKLSSLAESLRAAAQIRLDHPELSLSELAEMLGVSKSCLNHRFRKLMELSRELDLG